MSERAGSGSTIDRIAAGVVGCYRVERELGAGGMATVYLAHDLRHERDVAKLAARRAPGYQAGEH